MRQFHPFHSQLYLGKGRALYCGPLQHLEAHVYGAPVLHAGIYGPFKMMLGDGTWRSHRAAVVPGLRHALDVAGGVHGKLFVETDSPCASTFRCRFPYLRDAVTDLNDPEIVGVFRWIFEDDPQQEAVERRLDLLLAAAPEETHLDPRIQKIVELIRNEPDRNYSQGELAASLGLSPSRLLHLFSEQLGVPYRRLRMWRRLMLFRAVA
jgi:hypothetical protein